MAKKTLYQYAPVAVAATVCITTLSYFASYTSISAAELPLRGAECVERFMGTSAVASDGKIRFSLRDLTLGYDIPGKPDVVINVEPNELDLSFLECNQRRSQKGAIQVNGISVNLPDAIHIDDAVAQSVPISISDMGRNALQVFSENSINKIKDWVPRGDRYGLKLYQVVTNTKDGVPTEKSMFLGAMFVGHTPSGRYVRIDCLDFDFTRDRYCELIEQFTPDTKIVLAVPTEVLNNWSVYSVAAEAFFLKRLEE